MSTPAENPDSDVPEVSCSAEPRQLTLTDLLAVTFGFASIFSLPPTINLGGLVMYGISIPLWFLVAVWSLTLLQGLAVATLAAILARRVKYGRMPRPAEWLALIIAAHFFSMVVPNVDTLIDRLGRFTNGSVDFDVWRWSIAGSSLAVGVVLVLLAQRSTAWLSTTLLGATATLLMWGPCDVVSRQFLDLFPSLAALGDGWAFWMVLHGLNALGFTPLGLLFGVPAAATLAARRRDRFRGLFWTEWAAMACALLLGTLALLAMLFVGSQAPISSASSAVYDERPVVLVWLAIVALLSWLVVRSGVVAWCARA